MVQLNQIVLCVTRASHRVGLLAPGPCHSLVLKSEVLEAPLKDSLDCLRDRVMTQNQTDMSHISEQTRVTGELDCEAPATATSSLITAATPNGDASELTGGFDVKESSQISRSRSPLQTNGTTNSQWLPLTLRLPFLIFSILLSILLSIVFFLLISYSTRHTGLISDHGSRVLFFGWRFAPTLLATIYGIFVATILGDVRRTEIFARLSRSDKGAPEYTLCFPTRPWWFDPWDALSTKKNGGVRSWALFFASVAFVISLISSPLSAGLLSPVIVQVPASTTFQQPSIPRDFSWNTASMDSIMFRTISGAILKKPTSAWLSTDLVTLPFWPRDFTNDPLALDIDVDPRQWVANSIAYNVNFDCVPMKLTDLHNITMNGTTRISNYKFSYPGSYYQVESSDGCVVRINEVGSTSGPKGLADTWTSLDDRAISPSKPRQSVRDLSVRKSTLGLIRQPGSQL